MYAHLAFTKAALQHGVLQVIVGGVLWGLRLLFFRLALCQQSGEVQTGGAQRVEVTGRRYRAVLQNYYLSLEKNILTIHAKCLNVQKSLN